ncbi:hypothetical protein [Aliidiomarina quisquiliarum]|uniref:hypothetical protein n=1 Tax=Aliidiomarina quisquiliarum TaxID=2938947 RepID=UPI00208F1947|nr:hypothetical protein [Aliidiomarina quisquiliarum]MCO4320356.1 hypothetical protein [Aliidiomarina quisquiliarum]
MNTSYLLSILNPCPRAAGAWALPEQPFGVLLDRAPKIEERRRKEEEKKEGFANVNSTDGGGYAAPFFSLS